MMMMIMMVVVVGVKETIAVVESGVELTIEWREGALDCQAATVTVSLPH